MICYSKISHDFYKCLSVRPPWSWLIVNGYKDCENRTWSTKYRGQLYIHSSKKFDHEGYEWVQETFPKIPLPGVDEFVRGAVIGNVFLCHCMRLDCYAVNYKMAESPWFFGPYGWFFRDPRKFYEPVEIRGQLGIFNVPTDAWPPL
ncbi:ASCH domain-containing protein [Desulfatibacillum aliphaticivorans]|uniref:ASCH domain-containing protein n=1 Tax=Desulfatibacillum aliphaticivorans TaxID=218208 RepID=UPI00047F8051|nr:ASCH domain-containing protein [Desulfatibacillum aliphaticivorans]